MACLPSCLPACPCMHACLRSRMNAYCLLPGDHPHMTSARRGEGGTPKGDKVTEVAFILYCKSVPNADKGRRGSKNPNSLWTSHVDGPLLRWHPSSNGTLIELRQGIPSGRGCVLNQLTANRLLPRQYVETNRAP